MSHPSSDLFLEYKTQKSNENPYKKIKKKDHYYSSPDEAYLTKKQKKKMADIKHKMILNIYYAVYPHFHLLSIISVIFIGLFYTVIIRMKHSFMVDKYYHSLSLGLFCLIDYLINKEKYQTNFEGEEKSSDYNSESSEDNVDYKKPLIANPEGLESKLKSEDKFLAELAIIKIKKIEMIIYCISLGVISFSIEMLIFYLLKITTEIFDKNCSIGYTLISFEYIFIRFYYSMEDIKIEFLNFMGLLMIFAAFLFISLEYLSLPLGGVAFFVSAMRFSKFYLHLELNRFSNLDIQIIYLYSNIVDFIIGCVCMLWSILFYGKSFQVDFDDIFLVIIASSLYYLNGKYFRFYDR